MADRDWSIVVILWGFLVFLVLSVGVSVGAKCNCGQQTYSREFP